MENDIEVSTRRKGDVSIINIIGDCTAVTGKVIEDAYQKISAEGLKKILFCFDKEGYINSGGIAILIGIASQSRKKEQAIGLTGLSDHFQKIFRLVGLAQYTKIYPTDEAALVDF